MDPIYHMTYLQAVVIGLIQGITELFPISSLGHTVLIPSWLGGSWATLVRQESRAESPYLAFVVGLHLATAIVLLCVYAKTWVRIIRGFFTSITRREVRSADQKLAWLIVVATIPVGLAGLVLEHPFRVLFAKPLAAAIFLMINGCILLGGEILRRRAQRHPAESARVDVPPRPEALVGSPVPASAYTAPAAPDGREGVTMVGGLTRGLSHEDAMRFSFLLSTPVILAAGVLKLTDLTGSLGADVRGQIIAGSVAAAATSLFAVLFLARYFRTRTLVPFAIYCLLAGLISVVRFGLF
jgi:undecaprenyl-diphosphatase